MNRTFGLDAQFKLPNVIYTFSAANQGEIGKKEGEDGGRRAPKSLSTAPGRDLGKRLMFRVGTQ